MIVAWMRVLRRLQNNCAQTTDVELKLHQLQQPVALIFGRFWDIPRLHKVSLSSVGRSKSSHHKRKQNVGLNMSSRPRSFIYLSQARRDQVRGARAEAGARRAGGPAHAPEVVRGKPYGQAGTVYLVISRMIHVFLFSPIFLFSFFVFFLLLYFRLAFDGFW